MSDIASINRNIEELLNQTAQEGIVDDQFFQLLELEDESNPNFVSEVISLYLEDSGSKLERLSNCLSVPSPSFAEFDQIVHQFKGSSASFGAAQMASICIRMRETGHAQHVDACRGLLQELKASMEILAARLDAFSRLDAQRKSFRG